MHLYSNPRVEVNGLSRLLVRATSTPRPQDRPTARQVQVRLDERQASELAMFYMAGAEKTELAKQYRIHRTTVTAILQRMGYKRA